MQRPKMTRELRFERTVPECPHCGGDMDAAPVSLESIVDGAAKAAPGGWALKIDAFVPVDAGGYADAARAAVVATCTHCLRPAVLALDGTSVKLVAARTDLDRRFLERIQPCPAA